MVLQYELLVFTIVRFDYDYFKYLNVYLVHDFFLDFKQDKAVTIVPKGAKNSYLNASSGNSKETLQVDGG